MLFLSGLVSNGLRQTMALCLILSLVAGCTITSVPLSAEPEAISMKVKQGDVVNIVTTNQQRLRFTVENISERGISGDGKNVPYEQISEIAIEEKKIYKAGEVSILVIGAVVALAVVWGISELISSATDEAIMN